MSDTDTSNADASNADASNTDNSNADTDDYSISYTDTSETHLTDNTTAADHLDDIDISSYLVGDSLHLLYESVVELTARFEYYEKLRGECEEIANKVEDPRTYFEHVYYMLLESTCQTTLHIKDSFDSAVSE